MNFGEDPMHCSIPFSLSSAWSRRSTQSSASEKVPHIICCHRTVAAIVWTNPQQRLSNQIAQSLFDFIFFTENGAWRWDQFPIPCCAGTTALAAAARFVDTTVLEEAIIDNYNDGVWCFPKKAKEYIIQSVPQQEKLTNDMKDAGNASETTPSPKPPRFRFFSVYWPLRPRTSKTPFRQFIQKYKEGLAHAEIEWTY